jgi:hypothetical protein
MNVIAINEEMTERNKWKETIGSILTKKIRVQKLIWTLNSVRLQIFHNKISHQLTHLFTLQWI